MDPTSERPEAAYVELPGQNETNAQSLREVARVRFDAVADAYDRTRPGYPEPLFADLKAHGLASGTTVLEIGCGTGQATRRLAEVPNDVWCVELGPELARRARANLAELSHVHVLVGAFEDVDLPTADFDLVSATAFHWIDPLIAYKRAATLLRSGESLALCTNAHVAGGTQSEIRDDIADLHAQICPEVGPWRFPTTSELTARALVGGDIAQVWARIDRKFEEPPDVGQLF